MLSDFSYPVYALWFLFPKILNYLAFQSFDLDEGTDEGDSRTASSSSNLISTFVLLSLGRYLCCWTINLRGYPLLSSQCFYHWVDISVVGLLIFEGILC